MIKVLIVDDSKVARELLAYIIGSDPEFSIMGMAENGEEALKWLEKNQPDVITMDIQMPKLNGFQVIQKIMETRPIPIVVITSAYTKVNSEMAFQAMDAGALAILEKPKFFQNEEKMQASAEEIARTIKIISGIRLITKRKIGLDMQKDGVNLKKMKEIRAVAIGASLGGPQAIGEILFNLSASFPAPIFIVQHIAAGFIDGFVEWLQERCPLKVQLARQGQKGEPGNIYVAPDGCHMVIDQNETINLVEPSGSGPRPSVGKLFNSVANVYGEHAIGVILTGMGTDGAKELLIMKEKGAYTIAQDQESCIMFGMPQEAIALGAAKKVLPLDKIAQALKDLTSV